MITLNIDINVLNIQLRLLIRKKLNNKKKHYNYGNTLFKHHHDAIKDENALLTNCFYIH